MQDIRTFLDLHGSPTGQDFVNELEQEPGLLEQIAMYFDPSNPNFASDYDRLLSPMDGSVPLPPTLFLLLSAMIVLGLRRRKPGQAVSDKIIRSKP